ncbi:universal stress protein [Telmatospirillum siberiense]|uniref:Universal stress protein n=1 Tax=Telmatospirillum siberiense TaxID=382514 RepID=A0A2N3PSK4_9PROT|nr:universal stress protein [Telmatospirillum siberiense]PKU23385.1 universal stress protein [Telmatospirillum siberiense]
MVERRKPPAKTGRTFLIVVDDSDEMRSALRYACRRARNTGGRVALLRVLEPPEFQHFAAIGNLMQAEARQAAEALLQRLAETVNETSGEVPMLYVREGDPRDQLLKLIDEEPSISILVLAAGTGPDGPGPLCQALTGRYLDRLHIPLTIVPGSLSDDAIDALT